MTQVLKGHIVHAPALGRMDITENGFLVLEDGVIAGVYHTLPDCYAHAPLRDFGDKLIMQSFADMHLHAPQYPMLGMGMDLPLLDWLNAYTFKTEARFEDTDYARRVYRSLAGGTHCQWYHPGGYVLLPPHRRHADPYGGTGAGRGNGYVGKVNMDRNSGVAQEDHRGIPPGDSPLAGGLPLPAYKADSHPSFHPLLYQ